MALAPGTKRLRHSLWVIVCWLLVAAEFCWAGDGPAESGLLTAAARLRRPQALALSPNGLYLYVANRCGSISAIDVQRASLIAEQDVGERLSDLRPLGQDQFLATDEQAHEVLWLLLDGPRIEVLGRTPVSPYPVSVLVDRQSSAAYVASLWSRRLTRLDVPEGAAPAVRDWIDLEIAPRCQLKPAGGNQLLVADSFGGRLAIVDCQTFTLQTIRAFPGHNIRGLGTSAEGRMLVIAHQMLNDLAHTVQNDVHWGLLMSNDLRWLRLEAVLSPDQDLYRDSHMHPLGEPSNGMGDPSGLAVASNGLVVVSLGGVDEVAIGRESDFTLRRVAVGKRPTAVTVSAEGAQAFVANTFGDSISIVDLAGLSVIAEVSLGPAPELSLVERGEELFYSASLSHDRWMSCHSCHTDGHSNGSLNDNFSDGSFGAPKRVLTLQGCAETGPFAWNGRVATLEEQLHNSVTHTMQGETKLTPADSSALVSYLASLAVPPPVARLRGVEDEAAVLRGEALFRRENCVRCHAPPTYASAAAVDIGLEDARGNREFNPPSLRGLSQRGPYFHDNRAERLEDVFLIYGHQLEDALPAEELADLLAFLRSL
jgi:YVTN family beta-propeller protein